MRGGVRQPGELIGHGLAVFPAWADCPVDGTYHAPRQDGSDAAYQRAAELRCAHDATVRLLGFREHLPGDIAQGLEDLAVELAAGFDGREYVSWAFDLRRYLRAAAHLARDITAGELRAGQKVSVRVVMSRCDVSSEMAGKAIRRLTECGLLAPDYKSRGTARVTCHGRPSPATRDRACRPGSRGGMAR